MLAQSPRVGSLGVVTPVKEEGSGPAQGALAIKRSGSKPQVALRLELLLLAGWLAGWLEEASAPSVLRAACSVVFFL